MSYGYYQGFLERGSLHESGTAGYEKNYYRAYKSYKRVPVHVERGESYYRIGELLMEGDEFLLRDYEDARDHYEEAALYGHGEARYELGQMYERGRGVDADYALAKRYYHQALDVGCTRAAKEIGILFLRAPPGVLYDLSRAKIYLDRFEEHHEADADVHIALGDYYRLSECHGYIKKAFERYHLAIALNEGLGHYWIGQMHEEISSAHLSTAVGYYQKGKALSNDAMCMWRLGQLHVSGQGGLNKDIDAARILFVDAAMKGCEEAKKDLDELDAEIAKGKVSRSDAVKVTSEEGEKKKREPEPNPKLSEGTGKSNVESKGTPAKPVDAELSNHFQPLSWDRMRKSFEAKGTINFQPLSWDRMRACFEANGTYKYEQEPNQTSTSESESDEQLFKIINPPVSHKANVTNFQVRSKINEQYTTKPSKLAMQDSDYEPARGYKFKTRADLRKQLKKAEVSSPLSPHQRLELSTALLQSNQAQITAALDTTNKALLKHTFSLTLKLNKLSMENEQSAATINSNNQDIAEKFDLVDSQYTHIYQRLDVLEKECANKDKTIEMLMSKLNAQSQQLEALMRSTERR